MQMPQNLLSLHRQPPLPSVYDYDIEGCKVILLNEAEKIYIRLAKRLIGEVINGYASKMLPLEDKQQ